jgi:hypothetical protein
MPSPAPPGLWVSLLARVQLRPMSKRILIGALIAIFVFVLILAFAHAYDPPGGQKPCFAGGFWHAQWPKWIGCAIAAHENLVGGLFGSAAALGAVLIALHKFQVAEERREKLEERREKREQRRERLEQKDIQRVVDYYSRLLQPFDKASPTDVIDYDDILNKAFATGKFSPISSGPTEYRPDARDVWERLRALNNALKRGKGGKPDTKEICESIKVVVMDMHQYRKAAQEDLASRETPAGQ